MRNFILIDDDASVITFHTILIDLAGFDKNKVKSFFKIDDVMTYLKKLIEDNDSEGWPHYIISDIHMPGKTGFNFIEEYKSLQTDFPLPDIYFVSGSADSRELERIVQIDIVKGLKAKLLEPSFFQELMKSVELD